MLTSTRTDHQAASASATAVPHGVTASRSGFARSQRIPPVHPASTAGASGPFVRASASVTTSSSATATSAAPNSGPVNSFADVLGTDDAGVRPLQLRAADRQNGVPDAVGCGTAPPQPG